jgi:CBS domain-containing protein
MVTPVHTIHEAERLAVAERRMNELGISALPVVDDTGQLGGAITKGDLLRIGRIRGAGRERFLDLPDQRLREHASAPLELVARSAPMAEVARRMVRRKVHQVYVAQGRTVEGVISTRELMRLIADRRLERSVGDVVGGGEVLTVCSTDPVGLAIDRLVTSRNRELVVIDDGGCPVGVFDQLEAASARDASARIPVEDWMSPAISCVAPELPVHRAAALAASKRSRAIVVTDGSDVRGILTGLEFAALLAA